MRLASSAFVIYNIRGLYSTGEPAVKITNDVRVRRVVEVTTARMGGMLMKNSPKPGDRCW